MPNDILLVWAAECKKWGQHMISQTSNPVPSAFHKQPEVICPYELTNSKGTAFLRLNHSTDCCTGATQKEIIAAIQRQAADKSEKGKSVYDVIREGIDLQELR
jgi:hypothetical protein